MDNQEHVELLVEISTIAKRTEKALDDHVKRDDRRLTGIEVKQDELQRDVSEIKKDVAVNSQALSIEIDSRVNEKTKYNSTVTAGIASVVSVIGTYFATRFGV